MAVEKIPPADSQGRKPDIEPARESEQRPLKWSDYVWITGASFALGVLVSLSASPVMHVIVTSIVALLAGFVVTWIMTRQFVPGEVAGDPETAEAEQDTARTKHEGPQRDWERSAGTLIEKMVFSIGWLMSSRRPDTFAAFCLVVSLTAGAVFGIGIRMVAPALVPVQLLVAIWSGSDDAADQHRVRNHFLEHFFPVAEARFQSDRSGGAYRGIYLYSSAGEAEGERVFKFDQDRLRCFERLANDATARGRVRELLLGEALSVRCGEIAPRADPAENLQILRSIDNPRLSEIVEEYSADERVLSALLESLQCQGSCPD